ncbi:MAG: hypothetical protein ACTSRK_20545 [Promethearchaeota archaeon]
MKIALDTNIFIALIYASAELGNVDVLISNDHPLNKKSELKINSPQEFVNNYFPLDKKA